jgi:hypothetical protein
MGGDIKEVNQKCGFGPSWLLGLQWNKALVRKNLLIWNQVLYWKKSGALLKEIRKIFCSAQVILGKVSSEWMLFDWKGNFHMGLHGRVHFHMGMHGRISFQVAVYPIISVHCFSHDLQPQNDPSTVQLFFFLVFVSFFLFVTQINSRTDDLVNMLNSYTSCDSVSSTSGHNLLTYR